MASKNQTNERKPLFMYLTVAKENRLTEVKERHAGGKFSGLNRVYREKMNDVMKLNLLFTLFAAPFLVLTIWALGYMLNLSDTRFFIGGLGIDYHPGLVSELEQALIARLDVHFFYFALLIPSFTIMGIGLAGVMHVARKMFYGEEYKILKTFGQGIKKYWWQMMLVMTLIGALIFAVAVTFIEFYKLNVYGLVTGGWYAILFFVMLFAVMILFVLCQIAPQVVTYDTLKFSAIIKNSFILAIENFLPTLLLIAFTLAPILLVVYVNMFGILVYMIMFMFGFMYYIMANLQIGNYSFDLYLNPMYDMLGEEGAKALRKGKKEESKEEPKKENVQKTNKPKKQQPQKYVNPKKKKSNKK